MRLHLSMISAKLTVLHQFTSPFKRAATDIEQKTHYVGNNSKALHLSVEASLKKLRTSYIDILYLHWWDYTTSVEEVMNSLHALVMQGKVLYLVCDRIPCSLCGSDIDIFAQGVSDTPAWVVSKANNYARMANKTPFAIYQGAWSVMERDFEREVLPMARSEGVFCHGALFRDALTMLV